MRSFTCLANSIWIQALTRIKSQLTNRVYELSFRGFLVQILVAEFSPSRLSSVVGLELLRSLAFAYFNMIIIHSSSPVFMAFDVMMVINKWKNLVFVYP